ncbi:hypothetical protein SB00610_03814 [Klebsiella quasipneumoniae subsp. similipneumoniae]|nr:hypothetical protein SB00610_03814 [Klebsiella quasipneumoniae subsp. similipneumoniae]
MAIAVVVMIAGISAEKEAETFGGTVSGILIFSPLRPSSQQ